MEKTAIESRKALFTKTLANEVEREITFLSDIQSGRASRRLNFIDKLSNLLIKALTLPLTAVGTALPPAKAAAKAVELAGVALLHVHGSSESSKIKSADDKLSLLDGTLLRLYIEQFANMAALRYEALLVKYLDDASTVKFAQVGARRSVDYLKQIFKSKKEDQEGSMLMDILLEGLIQGHSGKYADGFRNHKLTESLTAEAAYARFAMRELPIGNGESHDEWKMYYRETALDKVQGKRKGFLNKKIKRGETKLNQKDGKAVIEGGPVAGFILVDEAMRSRYGFDNSEDTFSAEVNKRTEHAHYPSVYIAKKADVTSYMSSISAKSDLTKNTISFWEFIEKKETTHGRIITSIWLRGENFSGMLFERGDYSGVDFSGCQFDGATFKDVKFNQSKFTFVSAKNLVCKEGTSLNSAIFDGAEMGGEKASIDASVGILNVSFRGTRGVEAIKHNQLAELIQKSEKSAQAHQEAVSKQAESDAKDYNPAIDQMEQDFERLKKNYPRLDHLEGKLKTGLACQLFDIQEGIVDAGLTLTPIMRKEVLAKEQWEEIQAKIQKRLESDLNQVSEFTEKTTKSITVTGIKAGTGAVVNIKGKVRTGLFSSDTLSKHDELKTLLRNIANGELSAEINGADLGENVKMTVNGDMITELVLEDEPKNASSKASDEENWETLKDSIKSYFKEGKGFFKSGNKSEAKQSFGEMEDACDDAMALEDLKEKEIKWVETQKAKVTSGGRYSPSKLEM